MIPHARAGYLRVAKGRIASVSPTVVLRDVARRTGQLRSLEARAASLAGLTPQAPAATPAAERPSHGPGGPDEHELQPDLFRVAEERAKQRVRSVLRDRLANYARLTPTEAAHLAMARVRIAIARKGAAPQLAMLQDDLERLESILFIESLQRLPQDEREVLAMVLNERGVAREHQTDTSPPTALRSDDREQETSHEPGSSHARSSVPVAA